MGFKMKGPSLYKNSPMKQDKKALQKTPGEKVKPKYTLKVGNLPNGNKEYFKVGESGKNIKISETTYNSMKGQ